MGKAIWLFDADITSLLMMTIINNNETKDSIGNYKRNENVYLQ